MASLIGKVLVNAKVILVSGMRIGGSQGGLKIGGVDLNVITDPKGRPYIPGSSLKGKLRSLLEIHKGAQIDKGAHTCANSSNICEICKMFGVLAKETGTLTRLIVRDTFLDENSITEEMRENIELKYTEVKFETAIDRRTGTALSGSLRQIERVPAGAKFGPAEFVFNVYEEGDKDLLKYLFEAMELLENDYLGGMGSRGYGKVKIENIGIWWNKKEDYETGDIELKEERRINGQMRTPSALVQGFETIKEKLK